MTRKELESIYFLSRDLKMWQAKLQELEYDIAMSPKAIDGMPFQHTNETSSPTEQKAMKLAEVSEVIKNKIKEIQFVRAEGLAFITSIDDSIMRQIVVMRCIDCKKWEDIGKALGYDRTTVQKRYKAWINETFPQFP